MTEQRWILVAAVTAAAVLGGGLFVVQVRSDLLTNALREAMLSNNTEKAHQLLREGASPPAEVMGRTPLLLLAERGYSEIAQDLVQHGARPNVRTQDGKTPLLWAVRRGDTALAGALVEHGADPNAADWNGWSPLAVALLTDQTDMAMLLIQRGARADPRPHSDPSLRLAARRSPLKVVAALLQHKADPNVRAPNGTTPLMDTREPAFPGDQRNRGAPNGITPLMEAARRGDAEIVRALLDAGAEVDARDASGRSPLAIALIGLSEYTGPDEVDSAAREAGKDLGPGWDYQPMPRRAEDRDVGGVVEALVSRGASVNRRFDRWEGPKSTPLIAAALTGDRKSVQVLLAHGAHARDADGNGTTPLMMAALHANLENVQDLLAHGADAKARDRKGKTALDYARNTHHGTGWVYQSARRRAEMQARRDPALALGLAEKLAALERKHQQPEAQRAQIEQVLALAAGR